MSSKTNKKNLPKINVSPVQTLATVAEAKKVLDDTYQSDKLKTNEERMENSGQQYSKKINQPNAYYEILGINREATHEEIKEAIPKKMGEIMEAFRILSNPDKRKSYDFETKFDEQPQIIEQAKADKNQLNLKMSPYDNTSPKGNVFELARRDTRLVAHLVDSIILIFPIFFLSLTLPIFIEGAAKQNEDIMIGWALLFLGVILFYITLIIIDTVLVYQNGQTIGKRLLSIKIVRSDGSRAGLSRIFCWRYFPTLIYSALSNGLNSFFFFIDHLLIFQKSRRCGHDLIADTIVIESVHGGSNHRSTIMTSIAVVILIILFAFMFMTLDKMVEILEERPEITEFKYTDYLNYYKFKQGIDSLMALKTPTERYFSDTGKFPTVESIKGKVSNKYVTKIVSNSKEFYFQATLAGEYSPMSGKTLRLIYNKDTSIWKCSSGYPNGVDNKYLPSYCRKNAP
ncbi:RDD family protein [Candidatus Parabeggiatoa sp. HSG14]|uniref:RDD family protein n=1 Tax=Candidatus Parabeggiatoa sp. HSG14 TaxID=3055593 RepID=UPI0025A88C29|nr:RDD family protein [Thiotrichales bacterium HSG14]